MSMKVFRFNLWAALLALSFPTHGPGAEADRKEPWMPYGWEVDAIAEAVLASDIQLTHLAVGLADRQTESQFSARLVRDRMGVDYEPIEFDLKGESVRLDETTTAIQGSFRQALNPKLYGFVAGNVYDGFSDYRSLWLAEYYHQQFSDLTDIPGFDTYQDPDPHGLSVTAGLRWEYLPASGFLQLELGYARDEIAPGYEIDFDGLVSGPSLLITRSLMISAENVLSPRLRTAVQARVAETTDREPRFSIQGSANYAFSYTWRLRARLGGAVEDGVEEAPQFNSLYGSLSVESDLSETWSVFAYARGYRDTGEIENALLFSAAAPGLQSWAAGIGIKGRHKFVNWRLAWSPYRTDYEETGLGTVFFSNLYRDRTWNILELSGVFTF